ncbi:MAG: Ig-like domain-containing protein, partial [Muribaculaceae bacterium]|nr:Ig-like domain-containing protein [Muribaculaceae bacterium]
MHTLFSRFISILGLLLMTSGVAAANGLEVASVKITKGEEVDIPVMYTTQLECLGFQTEVALPTGLSFVAPNAYLPEGSAGSAMIGSQLNGDVLKVAGFTTGEPYPSSGVLFYLKIKAADDFMQGSISFSNTVLSDKEHREFPLPVYTVSVTSDLPDVESVTLSASSLELKVGQSQTLTATVAPSAVADMPVSWTSSDSQVVTVEGGVVTAVSIGTATVTASCGGKSATCTVSVVRTPVESISLSATSWEGLVGDSFKLTATVLPAGATDPSVAWSSSDETVAKVESDGTVTALAVGSAVITATSDGKSATCQVNVVRPSVQSISLSQEKWEGHAGDSFKLTATTLPEDAEDATVIWSSSAAGVATVGTDGTVTAVAVGSAVITASCGSVSASCQVTVLPYVVETISLSLDKWEAKVGESVKLTATVLPENATDKGVVWSSASDAVAKVDQEGYVTAVAVGETVITATAADGSGVKAECKVTVVKTPVAEIKLSASEWSGKVGESVKLTATVLPENATDKGVVWSSASDAVAKVDQEGYVTAVAVGETVITATAADGSGVKAECKVTVVKTPVAEIKLSASEWSGKVGESVKLTATVSPDNATDKGVVWSSASEDVAKVDQEGNVTAVAIGETVITATAADGSGVKAECKVSIVKTPVEKIELSASEWSGHVGDSFTLSAKVLPEDASDKTLSWSSSDAAVAAVSADGVVSALAIGEAVITVSSSEGVSASCVVKVTPILVESISLNPESWSGVEGETFEITVTILPENATDKAVVWSSSDENVAKVNESGVVNVLKDGQCVITATAADGSGLTADCSVNSVSGVEAIMGAECAAFDVYSKDGMLLRRGADREYLRSLTPDIY